MFTRFPSVGGELLRSGRSAWMLCRLSECLDEAHPLLSTSDLVQWDVLHERREARGIRIFNLQKSLVLKPKRRRTMKGKTSSKEGGIPDPSLGPVRCARCRVRELEKTRLERTLVDLYPQSHPVGHLEGSVSLPLPLFASCGTGIEVLTPGGQRVERRRTR